MFVDDYYLGNCMTVVEGSQRCTLLVPVCQKFSFGSCFGGDFGERPRQAADVAHLLLLASSQRRCSVDRAGALKVCLRCVAILTGMTDRIKRVQNGYETRPRG